MCGEYVIPCNYFFELLPRDKTQELVITKNSIAIKVAQPIGAAFVLKMHRVKVGMYDVCGTSSAYLMRYELLLHNGRKKLIELKEWNKWGGFNS